MYNEEISKYNPQNPMSAKHGFLRKEIDFLELPLPIRHFNDPGQPTIQDHELKIKGKKLWISIDKPYYPVSPCKDHAIYPSSYSLTGIKLNDRNNPLIPIDFGVPIKVDFDKIYLTTYLSRPRYFNALLQSANYPNLEYTKIRIYYTDNKEVELNWGLKPNMFRISQYEEIPLNNPLDLFLPWQSMPYLKMIHGFLIPWRSDSNLPSLDHTPLSLEIFDDNLEEMYQPPQLGIAEIPLIWQNVDWSGNTITPPLHNYRFKIGNAVAALDCHNKPVLQDDFYAWHIRRLRFRRVDPNITSALIVIKGEIA